MSSPVYVRALEKLGLPGRDLYELPASAKRFPDGAEYRIEIPSVEGPRCLEAVLDAAEHYGVTIHRVSQGSGVGMLTDQELDDMAARAVAARAEVSLFVRPTAAWGPSAMARTLAGAAIASVAWGQDQLAAAVDEIMRAAAHGFRSVLVSDLGVLSVFSGLRSGGDIPPEMQAKVSVMLPAANAASARVLEDLGADTINLPTDLTLPQIAAIRAAVDVPLDIYVESPDSLGGFVRHHELPAIVDVAAPVHLKFGLRNAPDVYPSGGHLEATTILLSRERVRRAHLGLDLLTRQRPSSVASTSGAVGAAVPVLRPDDP